jgi:hypothetical protein
MKNKLMQVIYSCITIITILSISGCATTNTNNQPREEVILVEPALYYPYPHSESFMFPYYRHNREVIIIDRSNNYNRIDNLHPSVILPPKLKDKRQPAPPLSNNKKLPPVKDGKK